MPIFLLISALIAMPGAVERGEVVFRPGPEESSVPERFRLEPAKFTYELEPVLSTPNYRVSRLRFASPITTPDPENNVVHAEYFRSQRCRPEASGRDRAAHPGGGFPTLAIHGGPPGRSGSRCALRETPLLRRAPAARSRPEGEKVPLRGHRADGLLDAPGHLRRPARRVLAESTPGGRRQAPGRRRDQPGRDRVVAWSRPSTPRSSKVLSCSPGAIFLESSGICPRERRIEPPGSDPAGPWLT